MTAVWQAIGVWSAVAFLAAVAVAFLVRPVVLFADNVVRTARRSPLSALVGSLFLAVFVTFAGTKPTPPGPGPDPEPVVTNRVTYVLDGGVNPVENPATFTTNDLPIKLISPTRDGYDFTGWLPLDTIPVGTTTDVTYTATWEKIPLPPPDPDRQPWPEASSWERIDLSAEYTVIENEDKSRRKSAIPVETTGDVVVPDVLKLHRVVSIGTRAFDGCGQITSVDIPEGVTNIADYAFYNCTSLTNVVFPSTLKSIGAYAFVGCEKLKQIHIEVPRLTIGERAFRNCEELETVRIQCDELIVDALAFFGCGGLTEVNFGGKQVTLAEKVFSGGYDDYQCDYCGNLTNVSIVATGSIEIGAFAFCHCQMLRTAALIAGEEMGVGASSFYECTKLQKATVVAPKTTTFGDSVFEYCSGLQTVELPDGLVGVPESAFSHCSSLQAVALSSNVTTIAYQAFDTCTSLTNVCLSEGLSVIEPQAFYECAIRRLELPQSLSSVGSRAFEKCGDLEVLLVREGDTNLYEAAALAIGERAFYRCSALIGVQLPQRTSVLPARVFADCERLQSINLPSNLTDIAESAFESCAALPYVDFPTNLASVGAMAFNGCAALTGFSIPTNRIVDLGDKAFVGTKYWNDWPNDSLVENNGYILGFKGNPTSVVLPEGCVAIPAEMFMGMTALTNVVVPASVKKVGLRAFAGSGVLTLALSNATEIGVSAFEGCANLMTVVLAEGLGEIPDSAFHGCASLLAVDIPESVRSIGAEAFRDCAALREVIGGEGVERVGDYAFAGCVMLQSFRFAQDVDYGEHVFHSVPWTENVLMPSIGTLAQEYPNSYTTIVSIVISSSQSNIVDGACAGCTALKRVEVPEGVKSIGARAFEGCTALTELVLSLSVTSVGSNAVSGCTSLMSVTTSGAIVFKEAFPELAGRLSDIRIAQGAVLLCDHALDGCTALTEIDLPWTLESIGASAFANCSNLAAAITVPDLVTSIGDLAFENCTRLQGVRYLGNCPEAGPNIYRRTSTALSSWVLRRTSGWTMGNPLTQMSGSEKWPEGENARPVRFMDLSGIDTVSFSYFDGKTEACTYRFFVSGCGAIIEELPEDPEREGYDFVGWFTAIYGGTEVEVPFEVTGTQTIYARWVREGADDSQEWGEVTYDVGKSHVYDGYLLDGDKIAGTVQVKLSKGKYSKKTEETTVSATAKAMILGEGKSISFKGVAEGVDESGGSCDMACTKRSDERELSVMFEPNELTGSLDGYDVVAVRNMFGEKTDWDKRTARAAVDDCGGSRVVAFKADGDSPFSAGYVTLAVTVGSKGKTKVSGLMPDGTKVSVSSQLLVREEVYEVPVLAPLYSGKKGGFGFVLQFVRDLESGGVVDSFVAGVTEWTANPGKANEFAATLEPVGENGVGISGNLASDAVFELASPSFEAEGVEIDESLLPDGVVVRPVGSKWQLPKADKVKFLRDDEAYEVLTEYDNPAGLKLTYTAKTGVFKGSFKVYGVTDAGRSKKYTANVNGAVVDGVGYGTAVIKKVGSAPVVIEPEAAR